MSESVAEQGAEVAADGMTAGTLLAQLRESAGVHIAALAVTLKVPVSRLEALEADQYDSFPDAVFMRALAASVCRTLKADPAPVLALLPHGAPVQLKGGQGINATFKDQGRRFAGGGASIDRPKPRLLGIVVVALLVAALAIAFLPLGMGGAEEQAKADVAAPLALDNNPPGQEPGAAGVSQAGTAAQEAAPQEPVASPAAEAASAVAGPSLAGGNAVPAAVPASSPGAAVEGALVIRARAPSWIQVRGASGEVVQKTLAEGESISAVGNPPWAVVIGRADATEVIVRGKPMDLSQVARENVARFEVK